MLNKQPWADDKGWSSRMSVALGATNTCREKVPAY